MNRSQKFKQDKEDDFTFDLSQYLDTTKYSPEA